MQREGTKMVHVIFQKKSVHKFLFFLNEKYLQNYLLIKNWAFLNFPTWGSKWFLPYSPYSRDLWVRDESRRGAACSQTWKSTAPETSIPV
jgi:hypothetical protein